MNCKSVVYFGVQNERGCVNFKFVVYVSDTLIWCFYGRWYFFWRWGESIVFPKTCCCCGSVSRSWPVSVVQPLRVGINPLELIELLYT